MRTILRSIGILMFLTIVWSCEGPEGPEGPQGQAGVAGIGTKGDKGDPGNANVSSHKYSVSISDWSYTADLKRYYYQFSPKFITSDIVTSGFVKVFMSSNQVDWVNLPFTWFYSDHFNVYNYLYETQLVEVFIDVDQDLVPDLPAGTEYFNIIAIAGQAVALNPKLNWENYAEIKRAYPEIEKSIISK